MAPINNGPDQQPLFEEFGGAPTRQWRQWHSLRDLRLGVDSALAFSSADFS